MRKERSRSDPPDTSGAAYLQLQRSNPAPSQAPVSSCLHRGPRLNSAPPPDPAPAPPHFQVPP